MRVAFVLLPNRKPKSGPPEELNRFWDAQWLGRLGSRQKINDKREITGITFDQPEIPYTALYLLGLLREDTKYDVCLVDLWEKGLYDTDSLRLKYASENCDVFLFSPFTNNYFFAKKCVRELKKYNPNAICVIGGHHASFCADECLNDSFDCVIKGKGEKALTELAKSSWKTQKAVIGEIEVSHKESEYYKHIIPAYDLLPEKYQKTYYARLFTTHGCPFHCVFCSNTIWHEKHPIIMPIDRVKKELLCIEKNISFEEIYVNDENFTLNYDHFINIAKLLKTVEVNWGCETRIDLVNKEKIKILAEYGCREIDYGLESLDRNVLRMVKKGIDIDGVYRTLSETAEQGIRCHVNLMVGLPGETETTAYKTVEIICDWIRQGIVSTVDYFVTVPYPGTDLFLYPNKYGIVIKDMEWNNYREDCAPVFDTISMKSEQIYNCWLSGLSEIAKVIERMWR